MFDRQLIIDFIVFKLHVYWRGSLELFALSAASLALRAIAFFIYIVIIAVAATRAANPIKERSKIAHQESPQVPIIVHSPLQNTKDVATTLDFGSNNVLQQTSSVHVVWAKAPEMIKVQRTGTNFIFY